MTKRNIEKVEGVYCFGLVRPSVETKTKLGFLNFKDIDSSSKQTDMYLLLSLQIGSVDRR